MQSRPKKKFSILTPLPMMAVTFAGFIALQGLLYLLSDSALSFWEVLAPATAAAAEQNLDGLVEVMVGIVALVVTVVSIVVQLAAQRYTPKITELFMTDRHNITYFVFMVFGAIVMLLQKVAVTSGFSPVFNVWVVIVIASISLAWLPRYMHYVFEQIQPDQVRAKITDEGLSALESVRASGNVQIAQRTLINSIDILSNIAVNSLTQGDREQALRSVESLGEIIWSYANEKEGLPAAWQQAPRDAFASISEEFFAELTTGNKWVEAKVLMELEMIFESALQHQINMTSKIATVIRDAGYLALEKSDGPALELEIYFFNNLCRGAINAHNVRALYSIFYHYRQLTEKLLHDSSTLMVRTLSFFKYYGQLANKEHLPFAMVIAANDVSALCQQAFREKSDKQKDLLRVFLELDQDSENDDQERANRGVRKAQAILGAFYLEHGADDLAKLIAADMQNESNERLRSIRDEILSVHLSRFWEVTDRGTNFDYITESRRPFLEKFFDSVDASK